VTGIRLRHLVRIGPRAGITHLLAEDAEVTFAPMDSLADGLGGLDTSLTRPVAEVASGSYNFFAEGDLLLAKVTPCFENGKKALAAGLANGVGFATSEVHVIRPDACRVDPRYLLYVLSSEDFRAAGMASMTGAGGLRRVSEAAVLDYRPRITDLPAQKAIADFLDRETARLDQLIEKKQRMVKLLEHRKDAEIQALLDHLVAQYGSKRFKYVCESITTGPFGSAIKEDEYIEGGIPILNPSHIVDSSIKPDYKITLSPKKAGELNFWNLKVGDIIMARRGELGRCAVVQSELGRAICGTGCIRLRLHKSVTDPSFVALLISSRSSREWLDLQAVGTTMKNLNEVIVARLRFPNAPFAVQLQAGRDVEARISVIGLVQGHIRTSLDRLRKYRAAFITAAVTGQIDVATWRKRSSTDRRLDAIQEEMAS